MKNNIIKFAQIAIAITFLFSACKKAEKKETVITEDYKGVFIVNEGGFGKSNGSVGLYKPGTGEYFEVFEKVNGRPLGDVIQSMTLINDKYYIVVNNSNKIEVVNQSDFKSVTTISVNQPRNILKISASKAYISQINSPVMSVLDLNTNTITKTISIKAGTDNMAIMANVVYVGKAYADMVYMVSTTTDAVVDSVKVGSGVSSIVNVGTSKIGVFSIGMIDFNNGNILENGRITILNDSGKVQNTIILTTAGYSGSMLSSSSSLYYNFGDGKMFGISNTATVGATSPLFSIAGSIYGVSIDPTNGNFFVMDAGNFTSAGKVYIYNTSGTLQKEITGGIVPSKAVFNY